MESLVVTCSYGQDVPVPRFDDGVEGFDAVLADVPCSGDGTFRKDPDALKRWHPGGGNALHATQVAVARRMARLVKPGGHLLYSTCSLNPVEDEAVVAAILKSGLRIMPHSGGRVGRGIYLADAQAKRCSHTCSAPRSCPACACL